jgi:hypothetical protein
MRRHPQRFDRENPPTLLQIRYELPIDLIRDGLPQVRLAGNKYALIKCHS